MQIARSFVPGGLAAWIVWPKPQPLARLEHTVEVPGRMDAQGREVAPLDEDAVRLALRKLKGDGIEALTVSLMNAYLNGAHEARIGQIAAEELPGIPVSLSHEVLPEMQEYERTLSTVANAAVRPVVSKYVSNLRNKLEAEGMKGRLSLLRSDGGLMSSQKAEEHPVNILMSGPAGGVTGALWVAKNAGFENILTLDVGGTSTDVALMRTETARSFSRLAKDTTIADLVAVLDEMAAQTRSELLADGLPEDQITSLFEIDVRYAGQAFEVPLTITQDILEQDGIAGTRGRMWIEQAGAGAVLRFDLFSHALLLCFLTPLLFLGFAQMAITINEWEAAGAEATEKAEKKDEKPKAAKKLNPVDEFLGAPAPEDPSKKKTDEKKGAKDKDGRHSPDEGYALAGIFAAIYLAGRWLEPFLVRRRLRAALAGPPPAA